MKISLMVLERKEGYTWGKRFSSVGNPELGGYLKTCFVYIVQSLSSCFFIRASQAFMDELVVCTSIHLVKVTCLVRMDVNIT